MAHDKKRTESMQSMVNKVNFYLANSPEEYKECRKIMASILESLLHEARCYKGFQYLYWDTVGFQEWLDAGQPQDMERKEPFIYGPTGDQTRVKYY